MNKQMVEYKESKIINAIKRFFAVRKVYEDAIIEVYPDFEKGCYVVLQ